MSRVDGYIKNKWGFLTSLVLFFIIVMVSVNVSVRFDLTSQSIYTIANKNEKVIDGLDQQVLATILIGDNLPPAFDKLKSETEFLLSQIAQENPNLTYELFDPSSGTPSQINALRQLFAEKNVFPTNLRQRDQSEIKEQLIYPYVHFQTENNEQFINILENRIGQETEQDAIYRSVKKLEDKIAKALYTLSSQTPHKVGFLAMGELIDRSAFDFVNELSKQFSVDILSPQMLFAQRDSITACIVTVRDQAISLNDLLLLDQYLMYGGKIIWMVEEYGLSVDSIGLYGEFIPNRREQNIADYLFNHGAKLTGAWLDDMKCTRIPQVIGEAGGAPQTELFNFPFHPVMGGNTSHPITMKLDEINVFFPTVIDTVRTQNTISKTPLISSSEYSRRVNYPKQFSFDFLKQPLDVDSYTQESLIIAMLLEGRFESYFKNRISIEHEKIISQYNVPIKFAAIRNTQQILITDMEFVLPSLVGPNRNIPPGYNKWERLLFEDNITFITNSIEYMLNGELFLDQDREEISFASLDKKKIKEHGSFWKLFNLIVPPLILFIVFGLSSFYLKRRYGTA